MARAKQNYESGHDLLKARRAELGLSLRQLGAMTGINASHIKDIEKGRKEPSITKTLRLLEAMSIPVKEYFQAIGYEEKKGKMVAVQGIEPRTLRI